jgi:hypothetical protein
VQARPQLPQFVELVCKLTQVEPHSVWPLVEHTHEPFEQDWPVPQARPQLPQFVELVCKLTQLEPHQVCELLQTQLPLEQMRPPLHTVPQPPQLLLSVLVFTHELPHVVPLVHLQEPLEQV